MFKAELFAADRTSAVIPSQERIIWLVSVLTFIATLILYAATMCRTVFWWDCGELAANASVLGIPHRPGFPLFVLLARVFGLVPAGAYFPRVTFLSVLSGAATAGLLTFILLRLTVREIKSSRAALYAVVLAVGAFSLCFSFWIQAVRTEVYALNALIFVLLMFLIAQAEMARPPQAVRLVYCAAFLFGLGLGGHHATLASTGPALALLTAVMVHRRVIPRKCLLIAPVFAALGLSVYLYLPIRAGQEPLLNWGWNAANLTEGAQSVIATDAFGFLAQVTPAKIARNLSTAILLLIDQLGRPLTFLAVLGFLVWFARAARWAWFLMLLITGNLLLVAVMATDFITWNADLHGYLLPALTALVFGLVGGFWLILDYTFALVDRAVGTANLRLALKTSLAGVSVILALTPGAMSLPQCNLSNNRLAEDLGRETVAGLPPHAVVIIDGVNWDFVLRGLQFAGGVRPDVAVIDRALLPAQWYQRQCRRLYPELIAAVGFPEGSKAAVVLAWAEEIRTTGRPVYWEFTERELPLIYHFTPAGHLFRLADVDSILADSLMLAQELFEQESRFFNAVDQLRVDLDGQGMYIRNLYRAGLYYERRGLLSRARELYRRALALNEDEGTLRAAMDRLGPPPEISSETPPR